MRRAGQQRARRARSSSGRGDDRAACSRNSRTTGSWMRQVEGRRDRAGIGAEEAQRRLLEDVEQADGGDDGRLGLVVRAASAPACRRRRRWRRRPAGRRPARRRSRAPDGPGSQCGDEPGEHRAEHEELAMRDIDHPHDAEDEAESPTAVSASTAAVDQRLPARRAAGRGRSPSRQMRGGCGTPAVSVRRTASCSRPRRGRGRPRSRWCARTSSLPPSTLEMYWWPKTWWVLPLKTLSPCGCSLPGGIVGHRLDRLDQRLAVVRALVAGRLHRRP